ncbi:MAG: S26 family signal peptidase [Phycisphaerales bacterium JB059]
MPSPSTSAASKTPPPSATIKETLTSVMIAFMMAFVFRGFVIEGFLIPTGSMAPTLLGKHMRFVGPETGVSFAVGPWDYADAPLNQHPMTTQGTSGFGAISVADPITDTRFQASDVPLSAGDRVFVLKYLEPIFSPKRWDVVVFKNPGTQENYIKRLVGLPEEQIALVAGDVFARPASAISGPVRGEEAWEDDAWRIQRKPEREQRAMFHTLFDSIYTPPSASTLGSTYRSPWRAEGGDWEGVDTEPTYHQNSPAPSTLAWRDTERPITDNVPYNQNRRGLQPTRFPAPDVAMGLSLTPESEGAVATAVIESLGHEFRAQISSGSIIIEMRPMPTPENPEPAWRELDRAEPPRHTLTPGRATRVEFWHTDQTLTVFIDGRLAAGGPERAGYELTPAERIEAATGRTLRSLLAQKPAVISSILGDPSVYRPTRVRWAFEGAPFTLERVTLKRDIYYQHNFRQATRAAHPNMPLVLNENQFFMCGDNSPSSLDSRLWSISHGSSFPWGTGPDPWISDQIDDTVGVVHRDLLIGKAFVVYFPAPLKD